MNTTAQQVSAMSSISDILHSLNLTKDQFAVDFSHDYIAWYTNKVFIKDLLNCVLILSKEGKTNEVYFFLDDW